MQRDERELLREKRSSLFSGRKRGSRILTKEVFIGTVFLAILFLVFLTPYFWNTAKVNATLPPEPPKTTPISIPEETSTSSSSIPSPSITIYSSGKTIYDTSTPPEDIVVSGSEMDSVYLSVDGESNISIPHDGAIAKINIASLNLSPGSHDITIFANNTEGSASSRTVYFTVNNVMEDQDIIGRIGVPSEKNGFEITIKSVTLSSIHTSVWILAKNTGDIEKSFNLSPGPIIIDNHGNQYESMIIERSGIAQSDLYPKAQREGAVFFDKFKEGTKAQELILYVNGDRFEFMLNDGKNI